MEDLKQKLKVALSRRRKQRITDDTRRPSAVLVPIFLKDGEYHILFTKRTQMVKYHKGEISFPGGAYHTSDKSLLETALRESSEEIGLTADAVEVLGELDDVATRTSSYIVTPYVAFIRHPCQYKLSPEEAEEIIEVPISAVMNSGCLKEETEVSNGGKVVNYSYYYQGRVIHGATARILKQLLEIIAEAQCNE